MNPQEQLELIERGIDELISREELLERLKTGEPLTIKAGFDPTAPDLHLGHTVLLQKMRQFQQCGHKVVFLIGDFTGMVGDPSGKSDTRKALTREEVLENAETYKQQVFKVLDPDETIIGFNSEWLIALGSVGMLELSAKYTVARMLERDDFERRYRENRPISIHEFMYPLLQGYDSVALKCDVELGGSDQKFNLLVGRELQRSYGLRGQNVLTMPLLVGLDGIHKMSKSLNNYVGINEPAGDMFGKLMSINDGLMWNYYTLLSDKSVAEIAKLKADVVSGVAHPMAAKKELAVELVSRYHGAGAGQTARDEFERVFSKRENPEDMQVYDYKADTALIDIITALNFAPSRNEARRIAEQGGVSLDGERITDILTYKVNKPDAVLKVGKRKFAKLKLMN
ncbi:tyrosine--tRNA ligase [Deferribacterales bacterium RsTz2092]|nr:tyrosine--tRNA ligase [Deferribacterales bacterium]